MHGKRHLHLRYLSVDCLETAYTRARSISVSYTHLTLPSRSSAASDVYKRQVYKGEKYLPLVTSEEQLFRITDAAIQFFDDNANPGERFRMTLERVGLDKFEEKIKEAYNG